MSELCVGNLLPWKCAFVCLYIMCLCVCHGVLCESNYLIGRDMSRSPDVQPCCKLHSFDCEILHTCTFHTCIYTQSVMTVRPTCQLDRLTLCYLTSTHILWERPPVTVQVYVPMSIWVTPHTVGSSTCIYIRRQEPIERAAG